ncbi:UV DNA damage repair endonuclease UvsE [Paenibacillus sp. CGMCC 1.16610]|uniref:UV DNA damage repair endonuclease UvsE n=1 Tax=Paenibacillus anseongense TaxID=2682845 RepID=A0ABW9UI96_9BACL|nr:MULTISPECIES: UV DNA damage repair endonuclease UvsE [Paenibacillus]MBA2942684.1 UV DNA damage repair endonuclease UvsE [Paenibacillus sp. CGMCC 1.16610]MVQ38170.1 UV DNA damage repair endonuclease UvsE [Paenibacillus anseongense]
MIIRLGYVAMSTVVKNASPSKTMTVTNFSKLLDREAAIRKLERLGAENLHNTLRLLRHNRAHDIMVFRFSSRFIPLIGHEMLEDWDPIPTLSAEFEELGAYAKQAGMRVSFHPDHFTVLSTPREDVLQKSILDLERHNAMLNAMGLGSEAMCNIHVGGSYGDKKKAAKRFIQNFSKLRPEIQKRITLENDDKTFNALETLEIAETVGAPMVLDVHHHAVNNEGEDAAELWPRIQQTWTNGLPPKIHVSSPKSETDPRSHADYVEAGPLLVFLRAIAPVTPRLDIMIEAKMKDEALFRLMEDFKLEEGIVVLDQASIQL